MSDRSFDIEEILTILAETPPRIAALTGDLPAGLLHAVPAPGEWCARDVLAHLRSCDNVWGNYMRMIIAEDRPAYRPPTRAPG